MEKENGESGSAADGMGGGGGSSKGDTSLLDAASLFGAYWGRDASSQAAAASLLGGGGFPGGAGSMSGFGLLGASTSSAGPTGGRYPPTSTLSVAASQAASLGLHPAASAAWWSMASQLAAQDYLARLQASGLAAFPPDPYAAALGALGGAATGNSVRSNSSRGPRAPRAPSHRSHNKEKSNSNNGSSYGLPKTSSPSLSSAQSSSSSQGLSALGLNSLAGSHGKATTHSTSSSSSKHSRKSSSSAAAKASALSGAYLAQGTSGGSSSKNSNSSSSLKEKEMAMLRGDLIMAQAAIAQNAYQAAVAAASHKGGKNSSLFNNPFGLGSTNSGSEKDRHVMESMSNLPHTILSAALEGSDNTSILGGVRLPPDTEIIKYTSSIVGPKVRKVPGTTNRGRKKTISLDPPHVSVLPALSSTGLLVERGGPSKRPKLDSDYGHLPMAHQNSANSSNATSSGNSASDRVEVIKLPPGSSGSQNSPPFSMSGYTGLSKELLQSIANQSGLNLAALEKQFAEQFGASSYKSSPFTGFASNSSSAAHDMGLNLSSKPSQSPLPTSNTSQRDASPSSVNNDDDGPLNLCVKSSSRSDSVGSGRTSKTPDDTVNSLHSLSSITANLGSKSVPPPPERISRRKPGAKPRRVIQDSVIQSSASPQRTSSSPSLPHRDSMGSIGGLAHLLGTPVTSESPGPKSSGSEDNDIGPWHSNKEGRPRNLGRGVSKPKKNTVASLLAQSRALGIRPALAHQYLQEAADLLNPELQEKLKAAMNDPASALEISESESEGPWESCPSDSEGADPYGNRGRRLSDHAHLRLPIAMGWKRETLMKGLSKSGGIKGDVVYYPPEPHSSIKLKNTQDLASYLEKNPMPPLTKDNFSYSSRPLIGSFLQITPSFNLGEPEIVKMSETEVAKRLEEARRALGGMGGAALAVEQRIELARQQQAAREARKDAVKGREQARLAREQERSEKAEQAKRDREVRNQQLMEERELKRQQAVMLKEQERERRRQHMALVKQLDGRRRFEEREKRKHRVLLDKLLLKERRLEQRKKELELLAELRKPQEDSTLSDQKQLPTFNRIPGLKLPGQAMADILMVFEFLNNFGQTLGFDMETMPSLNTLQMALLPDCCIDSEEELISVLTHLLACAIEDPGIPHPGRHTTILGQTLRTNEITPGNISELLRIYLYASATHEVKVLTGINPERDRERRVADHHQNDSEVLQQSCHGRNALYYKHLHSRPSWKLAERLKSRPYAALDPTTKASILARLCDNLLHSKSILRQIDASLDNVTHLRKERYLMDAKLRKLKMLHSRKLRMENVEKQQAMAIERMQRMVEESELATQQKDQSSVDKENDPSHLDLSEDKTDKYYNDINSICEKPNETNIENGDVDEKIENIPIEANHNDAHQELANDALLMSAPSAYLKELVKEKDKDCIIAKTNGTVSKDIHLTDKDSVMGDSELILSDVESEGTQPEEDEDKNLPADELAKKLDKLTKHSDAQLQNLIAGSHALRATCFGQDRYWRRYWSLSKCGGVFVEGMESAQPEIMEYHERVEIAAKKRDEETNGHVRGRKQGKKGKGKSHEDSDNDVSKVDELELRNIKSELNLSDHTRIIKYEPNLQASHGKVEGSPIKMEEKFMQQQKVGEENLLDIEDSIPTAFLVQKPQSNKNMYPSNDGESEEKSDVVVKNEDAEIKSEETNNTEFNENSVNNLDKVNPIKEESKDSILMNNLEELKKMTESVIQPWEIKDNDTKLQIKEEKVEIKDESNDPDQASTMLNTKVNEGKWFSILRKETSIVVGDSQQSNGIDFHDVKDVKPNDSAGYIENVFTDDNHNCSEIILMQGNRWDVINNLHLLRNPGSLLMNANGTSHCNLPSLSTFYHADSSLTMSGLDQELLDASAVDKSDVSMENETIENIVKEENGIEDILKDHGSDMIDEGSPCKLDIKLKSNCLLSSQNALPNYSNINLSTLTAYVSCDSPAPIQMTPEESEQLENCKINGMPKKIEGNYVSKDLRHGWWRITDTEQLKEIIGKLHPRGVRERELHNSFMMHLQQLNNKLQIEKGDNLATELSICHLDRVIALNGGYPEPDAPDGFSLKATRRIQLTLLDQVEALEDRVAAASMQVKGWKPGSQTIDSSDEAMEIEGESLIDQARTRLLSLEAAIERRYLRPPLGAGTPPAPAPSSQNNTISSPAPNASDSVNSGSETPGGSRPSSPIHNHNDTPNDVKAVGIPRGLVVWREAVHRSQTSAQLAMVLHALESAIAWDKSIMKANCQFCQSGDSEDKLLLCDGCDKGYHTYCFKPKMEKIPDGDWYCFECLNKATGEKVCIVCGGRMISSGGTMVPVAKGRLIPCTLCPRAYHQDCHYPPMTKFPRGKWYCTNCISKAPPKKPRNSKKTPSKNPSDLDGTQPPSPAASQTSTATTVEDCPISMSLFCQSSLSSVQSTPEKHFQNHHNQYNAFSTPDNVKPFSMSNSVAGSPTSMLMDSSIKGNSREGDFVDNNKNTRCKSYLEGDDSANADNMRMDVENSDSYVENMSDDFGVNHNNDQNSRGVDDSTNAADLVPSYDNDSNSEHVADDCNNKGKHQEKESNVPIELPPSPVREREHKHSTKKDRNSTKRLNKELAPCKQLLEEMELHDDSWPFLLPVNTKQFPTYKKVIRSPMDLSTIKRKLQELSYKSKEEFASDVRQIFHNCEVFNEDESPVGQAGHGMMRFFEERWSSV